MGLTPLANRRRSDGTRLVDLILEAVSRLRLIVFVFLILIVYHSVTKKLKTSQA